MPDSESAAAPLARSASRALVCGEAHTEFHVSMSPSNGPSAENARPGPAGRLTSALEVLFCSGFPTQLAITSALVIAGVPVFTADGRLSLSHVVLLSVIDTACVAALVACFLRAHGESAQAIFRGGGR